MKKYNFITHKKAKYHKTFYKRAFVAYVLSLCAGVVVCCGVCVGK